MADKEIEIVPGQVQIEFDNSTQNSTQNEENLSQNSAIQEPCEAKTKVQDCGNFNIKKESLENSEEKPEKIVKNESFIKKEKDNSQENNIEKEKVENLVENLQKEPETQAQQDFFKEIFSAEEIEKQAQLKVKNEMLKNCVNADLTKIQNFIRQGMITPAQGQNLKNLVLKKAFDKYMEYGNFKNNSEKAKLVSNSKTQSEKAICEFQKEKPNFFNENGRKEILNYLKNDGLNFAKEDLDKIANIVEQVEKTAIDRYLKKKDYDKKLKTSNDTAKKKLTANAQNSTYSENLVKTFTRKEIGKMSSQDFLKNEAVIMEQLRKGLIK